MSTAKSVAQKLSRDFELISCTYHEASHTIYALLHFIRVDGVEVQGEDKEVLGYTHYDPLEGKFEDSELIHYLLEAEINVYYAGLTGERIYYKDICGSDKFPMTLKNGCSGDIAAASDLIKKNNLAPPGQKRWAFKQRMIRLTKQDLEQNWDAVKLIAHALYKKKKLSYDDLRDILTKKSRHKDFWKGRFKDIDILFDEQKKLDEETIKVILFKTHFN